jgi:hypothetical protein
LAFARINRSTVSGSSQWTAQCSAVAPSGCAAFTSALFCRSVRTAALSCFCAASASWGAEAANTDVDNISAPPSNAASKRLLYFVPLRMPMSRNK